MFIWISKARFGAVCLILALAACVPAGGPSAPSQRAPVIGGALVAAVPAGYCLDRQASQDGADEAVMIAGRCASSSSVLPAVITISIGQPGSSEVLKIGARAMSDWFVSPAGRAALARDGRSGSVRVRQTLVSDGAFLLYLSDRTTGDYWRAIMGLRGRLVTVSVTAPRDAALDKVAGQKLIGRVLDTIRGANPAEAN